MLIDCCMLELYDVDCVIELKFTYALSNYIVVVYVIEDLIFVLVCELVFGEEDFVDLILFIVFVYVLV